VPRLFAPILAAVAIGVLPASSAFAADLGPVIATAMEGTRAPAMAMLVMHAGKVTDEGVQGVRRNDRPGPAQISDNWLIGSDAKPMTATLIARLVDRGLLSWDEPLSRMLPELAAGMRPEYRSVTLVELLSHRAGFDHDTADLAFFNGFFKDPRPLPAQRLAYVTHTLAEAPVAPPGTKFSYSNTGFLLAAVIAEHATHKSYEELMRTEVFGPLGMTHVGFGITHDGQPLGHHDGRPATLEESNPAMFAPAGNINMSLPEWALFCLDQMAGPQGGGKLLKAATYQRMQTPIAGGDSGLAWGIQASAMGRKGPVLTHAGSDGNGYAVVALFPAVGDGVLAAANAGEDMGGDKAVMAALKAVAPTLSTPK
jgi:CubicO group peptidase (beta-lactamase class C family)